MSLITRLRSFAAWFVLACVLALAAGCAASGDGSTAPSEAGSSAAPGQQITGPAATASTGPADPAASADGNSTLTSQPADKSPGTQNTEAGGAAGKSSAETSGSPIATTGPSAGSQPAASSASGSSPTGAPASAASTTLPNTSGSPSSSTSAAVPPSDGGPPAATNAGQAQPPAATPPPTDAPAEQAIPANSVSLSVVGDAEHGKILETTIAPLSKGDTVLDVLKRTMREHKIQMEYTGAKAAAYVEGIDNLYEFDRGAKSGWLYRVNGVFPNKSAGAYSLKEGDKIEWLYTLDLGKDVGAPSE